MTKANFFSQGAWPTMVTPFREDGSLDYNALGSMTEWYIGNGADGLFAACQSSEIFNMSLRERVNLSRFVKEQAAGRVPVIASGHISSDPEDQAKELAEIAETGVDAVVLISNRLAAPYESDDILLERLNKLVEALPKEISLGFYECPYPYKRLLTPAVLKYCVSSGRVRFLKDTCCDVDQIEEKLRILKGSEMRLYNANTATLTESLRRGAAGYSGVMANFQMKLYSWLVRNWETQPEPAQEVQDVLTVCSYVEMKNYPANAKYFLNLCGLPVMEHARKGRLTLQSKTEVLELKQIYDLTKRLEIRLGI